MSIKNIPIDDENSHSFKNDNGVNNQRHNDEPIKVELSSEGIKAAKEDEINVKAGSDEDAGEKDVESPAEGAKEDNLSVQLEEEKKKSSELYENMLRLKAEFENYKKRMERERVKYAAYAKESVLLRFLPTLDNLERSLAYEGDNLDTLKSIVEGVSIICKDLKEKLKEDGIERMDVVGKKFSPFFHEAISVVKTDEYDNETIINEVTPGYTINGNVLRPAKVIVAKNEHPNSNIIEMA